MSRLVGGKSTVQYEKVAVDEWLTGTIADVQYDEHREYKHKNEESGEWEKLTAPHVRLKFALDGYRYPHYSRWMKCSTHEKSNFYSKYLKYLCPTFDCQDKVIDLDLLKEARVKTMWENHGEFQNLVQIRGLNASLNLIASGETIGESLPADPIEDEEPPF